MRQRRAGTVPQNISTCADPYTIHGGDTLATIAEKFNTSVDSLLAANPKITNRDLIMSGDSLCIPKGEGEDSVCMQKHGCANNGARVHLKAAVQA